MKKIFYGFMAVVMAVVMSFGFVSCGNDNKPDKGEKATLLRAFYWGDYYKNQGENFMIYFCSGTVELDEEEIAVGSGYWICVDLNATGKEGLFPANAKYPVSVDQTPDTGFIAPGYADPAMVVYGTYVMNLVDGLPVDTFYVVDGYLDVKGSADDAKFELSFVLDNGDKLLFNSEGATEVIDMSEDGGTGGGGFVPDYSDERDEVKNVDIAISAVQVEDYGDYYMNNTKNYTLQFINADETWGGNVEFFANVDANSPVGTYKVDMTYAEGTVLESAGEEYDIPSYIYGDISDQSYGSVYYIVDGTMTVTENTITFNFTTAKGSTFKATYEGVIDVLSTGYNAPVAKVAGGKAVQLRDVRHNGFRFKNVRQIVKK